MMSNEFRQQNDIGLSPRVQWTLHISGLLLNARGPTCASFLRVNKRLMSPGCFPERKTFD